MDRRRAISLILAAAAGCKPGPDAPPAPAAPLPYFTGEVLLKLDPAARSELDLLTLGRPVSAITPLAFPEGWVRVQLLPGADTRAEAAALAGVPGVTKTQLNLRYVPHLAPSDPRYSNQYAHRLCSAEAGWDLETGDRSVVVAVIGTGVSLGHAELNDNLWINDDEVPGNELDDDGNGFIDDVNGWDFADGDANPRPDGFGSFAAHETSVAGIIGAEANNDAGIAGVSWQVSLMALRMAYSGTSAVSAIGYAIANGADVINMSWGAAALGEAGRDELIEEALLEAEAAGIVSVASAGNDGTWLSQYPAAHPWVISVAATTDQDTRASFSNHGLDVDVAAPGEAVLTTTLVGSFALVDGTSFSAPYVSGAVALLRAKHPTWTTEQIRTVIAFSGDKINTDHFVGHTRINLGRALSADGPPDVFARFVEPFGSARVSRGSALELRGTVFGDRFELELRPKGTLAWQTLASGGPVITGPLAVLETSALAEGDYQLRITAMRGDQRDSDWLSLSVAAGPLPGWPVLAGVELTTAPSTGDLDGDGRLEVVVAAQGGEIIVRDSAGRAVPGWPQQAGGWVRHPPALADLDGDGRAEVIVAASATGVISIWRGDGTPFNGWPAEPGLASSTPVVADVDGDGSPELVSSWIEAEQVRVEVRHVGGEALPGWPMTLHEPGGGAPLVVDLEGDGRAEILIGTDVYAHLWRAGGQYQTRWPRPIIGARGRLAAVDLDRDGTKELLIVEQHRLTALTTTGHYVRGWPFDFSPAHQAWAQALGISVGVAIGDLDADGSPEVAFGLADGSVWALDAGGVPLFDFPVGAGDPVFEPPVIGDVDEDGRADLLLVSGDGRVYGWNAEGRAVAGLPRHLGATRYTPALADLDGEGTIDLVLSGTGLHAIATGARWDPFAVEWPRERHDPGNGAVFPGRFPLEARAEGAQLVLQWTLPPDVPAAAHYQVHRDRKLVGISTEPRWSELPPSPGRPYLYGIVAVDAAGAQRARSERLEVTLAELLCAGRPDGAACDDGNVCTSNDLCSAGVCAGTSAARNGLACDDLDACTEGDRCEDGACLPSTRVTCEDDQGCRAGRCNPDTGACELVPKPEGTACEDGDACTGDDRCFLGVCTGGYALPDEEACDDGDSCTSIGRCRSGRCEGQIPLQDGLACDDGNDCTAIGVCSNGTCEGDDPIADGASCDDGNACTLADACTAGRCGGEPVVCTEASACRGAGTCDPETGVCSSRQLPDHAGCDDGDPCTQWDFCRHGICIGRAPVTCAGGGLCSSETGICLAPAAEELVPPGCTCKAHGDRLQGSLHSWVLLCVALLLRFSARGRWSRGDRRCSRRRRC